MELAYILSFAKTVEVETPEEHRLLIRGPAVCRELVVKELTPGLRRAFSVLLSNGATENELAGLVREADGAAALAKFYYCLLLFAERRMLCYGLSRNGRNFAILCPVSEFFEFSPVPPAAHSAYTLSRFAYLHREGRDMVLESPLAHGKIVLNGWEAAAVIARLGEPQTVASLCSGLPDLPAGVVSLFLEMLVGAGFASKTESGRDGLAENDALTQWEFHDLLFHARSRLGRHANSYGGTYRFYSRIKPLPAVKRIAAEDTIALYRPDIDSLTREDFPFTLVLEERRSIREYADKPITGRQTGEFLFRSARVKESLRREYQDLTDRPYPGAGAVYELEFYLSVGVCDGIDPGLYHYCPHGHLLERICGRTQAVNYLLKEARSAAGLDELPQILITIAARFQRMSWKYESMAYSAILKNVGALYQTMYLVATAMDLAPCALGGGNSDVFARAAELDYYTETSVGEFLIGSKRI